MPLIKAVGFDTGVTFRMGDSELLGFACGILRTPPPCFNVHWSVDGLTGVFLLHFTACGAEIAESNIKSPLTG